MSGGYHTNPARLLFVRMGEFFTEPGSTTASIEATAPHVDRGTEPETWQSGRTTGAIQPHRDAFDRPPFHQARDSSRTKRLHATAAGFIDRLVAAAEAGELGFWTLSGPYSL